MRKAKSFYRTTKKQNKKSSKHEIPICLIEDYFCHTHTNLYFIDHSSNRFLSLIFLGFHLSGTINYKPSSYYQPGDSERKYRVSITFDR